MFMKLKSAPSSVASNEDKAAAFDRLMSELREANLTLSPAKKFAVLDALEVRCTAVDADVVPAHAAGD